MALGLCGAIVLAAASWMWGTRGTGATEQGTTIDTGGFDIVRETPTVPVPTSPVTEADYLRSASGSVVAAVVEAMEAGDVDTLLSLVTWNQVTCAPVGNRGVPSCSVLGLPPETTIQTLANAYLPGAGVPEAEVRTQFASYLGAEPQLIAAAQVVDSGPFDNAPETMLEFAIDPRRLADAGDDPVVSVALGLTDGSVVSYHTYPRGGSSLIASVRDWAQSGDWKYEMDYVSPDAQWREDAFHEVDVACRTDGAICPGGISWPNDTWPSRQ